MQDAVTQVESVLRPGIPTHGVASASSITLPMGPSQPCQSPDCLCNSLTCPDWYWSKGVCFVALTVMVTVALSPSESVTACGQTWMSKLLPGDVEVIAVKRTQPSPGHTAVKVRCTTRVSPTFPDTHGPFRSNETLSSGHVDAATRSTYASSESL